MLAKEFVDNNSEVTYQSAVPHPEGPEILLVISDSYEGLKTAKEPRFQGAATRGHLPGPLREEPPQDADVRQT
jgi:hypothetical protein